MCLLNTNEKTHFYAPVRSFFSTDLAMCSPTLLPLFNFKVEHKNDSFSLLVSYLNSTGARLHPPTYYFPRADWDQFLRLSLKTREMSWNRAIEDSVLNVLDAKMNAINAVIRKT
ncbi:hypothetical protein TNCV_124471 [Trichonephila clavipes]|nr:hypothetical protein TNCV_124471 [Trichonephila clavipes]